MAPPLSPSLVLAAAEPSKLNDLREVAPAALEWLPLVLAAAEPSKLNDLREVAPAALERLPSCSPPPSHPS